MPRPASESRECSATLSTQEMEYDGSDPCGMARDSHNVPRRRVDCRSPIVRLNAPSSWSATTRSVYWREPGSHARVCGITAARGSGYMALRASSSDIGDGLRSYPCRTRACTSWSRTGTECCRRRSTLTMKQTVPIPARAHMCLRGCRRCAGLCQMGKGVDEIDVYLPPPPMITPSRTVPTSPRPTPRHELRARPGARRVALCVHKRDKTTTTAPFTVLPTPLIRRPVRVNPWLGGPGGR